jgi:hypothetical protein
MKVIRCRSASAASDEEVEADSGELTTNAVGLCREGWLDPDVPVIAAGRPNEKVNPLVLAVDMETGTGPSVAGGGVWEGLGWILVRMWIIGWLERRPPSALIAIKPGAATDRDPNGGGVWSRMPPSETLGRVFRRLPECGRGISGGRAVPVVLVMDPPAVSLVVPATARVAALNGVKLRLRGGDPPGQA